MRPTRSRSISWSGVGHFLSLTQISARQCGFSAFDLCVFVVMVRWQMDREAPTCYTYSTPTNNWQRKAVKVGRTAECIMMDPCRSRVEEVEKSTEPWHRWVRTPQMPGWER